MPILKAVPVVCVGVVQGLEEAIPQNQTRCAVCVLDMGTTAAAALLSCGFSSILHGEVEASAGQRILQMSGKGLLDGLRVVGLVGILTKLRRLNGGPGRNALKHVTVHKLPKLFQLLPLAGMLILGRTACRTCKPRQDPTKSRAAIEHAYT